MGSRRTQSSARHTVSSCRPGPPPFATRQAPGGRSKRPCRSKFERSNPAWFSSLDGHEMGRHRVSGRLVILATPISTSAAERQFPAGPIAPSTAPALTCPEGQTNHRLPKFKAHVTPVTSARPPCRYVMYIYLTEACITQPPASHPLQRPAASREPVHAPFHHTRCPWLWCGFLPQNVRV